jgi:CheY-like chemotaxis protein
VSFADGGAAAVAAATDNEYDVIVMDVRMPEMDGLEATRHIRALPPPRGQVPIVAMTAQAFAEQVVECHLAGMNGHVTKPFAPEVLCAAVRDAALPDPPGFADAGADIAAPQSPAQTPAPSALAETKAPALRSAPEAAAAGFDSSVFASTVSLLEPEILVSSLQTLGARGRAFLHLARSGGKFENRKLELAELAHTLGGCAGMFGFARLANASKRFEYAVQSNAPETAMRAADLIATVDEALTEIDWHLASLGPASAQAEQDKFVPAAGVSPVQEKLGQEGGGTGILIRAR